MKVFRIQSILVQNCELCDHSEEWNHDIAKAINHYIEKDVLNCFMWVKNQKKQVPGNPISDAVAILGK